jgi:acyl-CoA thioesterase-1
MLACLGLTLAPASLGIAETTGAGGQKSAAAEVDAVATQSRTATSANSAQAKQPDIGVIPPIVPVTPPHQTVMSIQCAVPNSALAENVPLPRLAKRLRNNLKPVVLAVGSSSTWGVGSSSRRKTYPAQLENILEKVWSGKDVEVINRGVSGETASGTADRLLNLAAQFKPDLILWQLGTNDAVLRVRIEDFTHTVVSTVRKLREANIDVVLVGLQYTPKWARDSHYFAIRDTLYKIARQEKLLYVRRYKAMEFLARTNKSLNIMARDNFHLNDMGYQCMAEQVAQAVVTNLFLRRKPPADKKQVQ